MTSNAVLEINNLSVRLPQHADRTHAIENFSLRVSADEVVCLVGESGSGKSMTSSAILQLLPPGVLIAQGDIRFQGQSLLSLAPEAMRNLRGSQIGMIFQEPMTALNPLMTIGAQIAEVFYTHTAMSAQSIQKRVLHLLEEVHLPDPAQAARAYPHELSGGQRQRAMIAMALALEPTLIIADEPTTALDVTTQAQILSLIKGLQQRKGTAVVFITHDFGVVAEVADRVAVLQHGHLVEEGSAQQMFMQPKHAYTQQLLAAIPSLTPPTRDNPAVNDTILTVRDLNKRYQMGGFFQRNKRTTQALSDVSFQLQKGNTLGIVGESGSGKSTLARCLTRLITADSGSIQLGTQDLTRLPRSQQLAVTKRLQMVFQDPFASLNPRHTIGQILTVGPIRHGKTVKEAQATAERLLLRVGLDISAMQRYPHEFSGGQRQRIGLARALALEPEILIADEPVSALDVSVQAQVLALLQELKDEYQLSMIFVTHDLRVAAQVCDQLVVMQQGQIVEAGITQQVFSQPQHPYTQSLLSAIPGKVWTESQHFLTDRRVS